MSPSDLPRSLELLTRFDDAVDGKAAASVIGKIASLLGETGEADKGIREQLVETIDRVPRARELAGADALAVLRQALSSKMPTYPNEASTSLHGQLTLAEHLDADARGQVAADLERFLQSPEAQKIRDFVAREIPRVKDVFESSGWLRPLGRRLASAGNEASACEILMALLSAGKLLDSEDEAVEYLLAVLRDPSQTGWRHTLRATGQVIQERAFSTRRKRDLPHVQKIFDAAVEVARSQPTAVTPGALDLALDLALVILQSWNLAKEPLVACLAALIRTNGDPPREAVKGTVQKGVDAGILTPSEQESIIESMVAYLRGAAPETPQQLGILYDTLELLRQTVSSKANEIYEVVRSYSRPDGLRPTFVQPGMRPIAYQHIAKIGYIPKEDARHQLGEMLHEAMGAADDSLRKAIVETLAALRKAKIMPASKVWFEIHRYVVTLGDSYQELAKGFA